MKVKIVAMSLCFYVAMSLCLIVSAGATPSTTYWTPCVYDVQGYGVWHIGIDNYFTALTKFTETPGAGAFPTDVGLTVGVLPGDKIQAEVGIDYMEPLNDPFFLNGKIGMPEGALFSGSPAVNLGIFNVGLNQATSGQNIIHLVLGKDLGAAGRIHACPYYTGNFSSLGLGTDNSGWMLGYDKGFAPVKDSSGEYNRIVFAADYSSGNNALGGGGFGLYYFFNKTISLLTGPVFFNSTALNGKWKWTTQLDINI
ncbi:hypothetical protein HZC34_00565 [Candidatus Saganbacteria bacterium]|nr:hypothetical protein [Candidatus Saganbacteria bacterium]